MALDEYGLTPKQRKFADYYIESGNATESAKRAGYSEKTAQAIGCENLSKPLVKSYIAQITKADAEKRIASADDVLQFLSDVMAGKVKDQFGLDASLQDRIKAGQELMKRYAVADIRQQTTMARLDSLFVEFRAALTTEGAQQETTASAPTETTEETAQPPEERTASPDDGVQ